MTGEVKTQTMWAIVNDFDPYIHDVRRTRAAAVAAFATFKTWRHWKSQGFKVVRVEVRRHD